MGIGDWGLGPIANPQDPIPDSQAPKPLFIRNERIEYCGERC